MRIKPFWEVEDLSKKDRLSLKILLKKLQPHIDDIWKSNNNITFGCVISINNLYKTKYPSVFITTKSNFEHLIIDVFGNCELGTNYTSIGPTINKTFYFKGTVEKKVKEILCSGK